MYLYGQDCQQIQMHGTRLYRCTAFINQGNCFRIGRSVTRYLISRYLRNFLRIRLMGDITKYQVLYPATSPFRSYLGTAVAATFRASSLINLNGSTWTLVILIL